MDEMKYLTELSARDYYFSTQRTSTVALAAMLKAINDTCNKELHELLGAFLLVIMQCFEFDNYPLEPRLRFQALTKPEAVIQEEDYDVVDDSEKIRSFCSNLLGINLLKMIEILTVFSVVE